MDIADLLILTKERGGSDLHLSAGSTAMMRLHGELHPVDDHVLSRDEVHRMVYDILADEQRRTFEENRDFVDAVLERLAFIGERGARMRRRFGGDDDDRRGMPPLVRAAIENLREVAAKRLDDDAEAEAKVVEVLARAAAELKKK